MLRFDDILGQSRAIDTIRRAYRAGRLPHGLIFAGPQGVGKGTTADVLAALWLCDKPGDAQPCGHCPSCLGVLHDNHPDLHRVHRLLVRQEKKDAIARDLSIDVIRQHLVAPANLKSVLGRGKAFIVEQAELMSVAAQNTLLKTLEEPPGRTLVMLLTDQPGVLLATIRSRCQLIGFTSLDPAIVHEQLVQRGIEPARARQAAELCLGSLGLALRWLEDGVIDQAQALFAAMDKPAGPAKASELEEALQSAADDYTRKQLARDAKASKDQSTRDGLSLHLRLCAERVRRRLAGVQDPQALESLCQAIEQCLLTEDHLGANVNTALAIQHWAMHMGRR